MFKITCLKTVKKSSYKVGNYQMNEIIYWKKQKKNDLKKM